MDLKSLKSELENLPEHPININSKQKDKLATLGIISYNQLLAIQNYIEQYGKIIALEELGQIKELDKELIRSLKPFIQFDGITDSKTNSLKQISKQSKNDLTLHYQQFFQNSEAYNGITPTYLGNPMRLMLKFSSRFYKKWRIGVNLEKDAGEAGNWNYKQDKYG